MKPLALVAHKIADGRVPRLIEAMRKAGSYSKGRLFPTERGTPQGGVVSPLLGNILLTPFDREMRREGYRLTRYAGDRVVTCESAAEARAAVAAALKTKELIEGLNPVLRGWGHYYKRAHVRTLFHRLDGWIARRIRPHRCKRWRNGGWRQLPETKLYGEYGLVNRIRTTNPPTPQGRGAAQRAGVS